LSESARAERIADEQDAADAEMIADIADEEAAGVKDINNVPINVGTYTLACYYATYATKKCC
jgi:hypothetical protein